ncbi:hypothetical protein [Sphingobium yanoikuyae]|uniref:hypothetical protein n=1 Tax=Sphingobium yanoikuyae TaxID=13690 RepID=UPI000AE5797E|nr:hypothetical protein [Sphingobium yanoikuyae]MDV3480079.1 hypothetical protein [Sphingobium yanoikuyae]
MPDSIDANAVALSLMREALSLLDTEGTEIAADHLKRAIEAMPAPSADDPLNRSG